MELETVNAWLVGGGLVVGLIFGALAQHFRFCMVTTLRQGLAQQDYKQMSAFIAALLLAITGTQLLELTGTVDIAGSAYRNSQFDWLGVILGGVLFGMGSTLARGCAVRSVVRFAEGHLGALVALVSFLVFAAITQFMFLEPVRLGLTRATAISLSTDAGLAAVSGIPAWLIVSMAAAVMLLLLLRFRKHSSLPMLLGGAVIGLLVVAGWYITGVLAQDEFNPVKPSSISLSGPLARIGYMLLSGKVPAFSFVIAFITGLAAAAFISAVSKQQFRIIRVDVRQMGSAVIGGALMGIGGILAYGCNVGQGLSGISTLSVESILAFVAIIAGTVLAIRLWSERQHS